jgi:hypothetical protein
MMGMQTLTPGGYLHIGGGPERHVLARRSAGRPSLADDTGAVPSVDDEDNRVRTFVAPKLTCFERSRRELELLPCLLPRLWSSRCR